MKLLMVFYLFISWIKILDKQILEKQILHTSSQWLRPVKLCKLLVIKIDFSVVINLFLFFLHLQLLVPFLNNVMLEKLMKKGSQKIQKHLLLGYSKFANWEYISTFIKYRDLYQFQLMHQNFFHNLLSYMQQLLHNVSVLFHTKLHKYYLFLWTFKIDKSFMGISTQLISLFVTSLKGSKILLAVLSHIQPDPFNYKFSVAPLISDSVSISTSSFSALICFIS